jgi:hypothetical protein
MEPSPWGIGLTAIIARHGPSRGTEEFLDRGCKDGDEKHRAGIRQLYAEEKGHWDSTDQPTRMPSREFSQACNWAEGANDVLFLDR